jgi:hypothetical protein
MICFDLDYAIIAPDSGDKLKLQHMPTLSESTISEPPIGPGVRLPVLLHTAQQGTVAGWLCREGIYARFRKSLSYQEVYHVSLDSPVLPGDCGAIVVDHMSRKLYGHVITSGTGTNDGFVVPATLVLGDLSRISTALNAAETTKADQQGDISSGTAEPLLPVGQHSSNPSSRSGKTKFSRSEQQMRWDKRLGAWEASDDDETCSKYASRSQTSGPPDSPRSLATSISDAVVIQHISPLELRQRTPIEIYRSALAEILVRLTGCRLAHAQNAIHIPKEPHTGGDLVVMVPRLHVDEGPEVCLSWNLPLEIMKAVS